MITYCIQVVLGTAAMYGLYLMFLKDRTALRFSRLYLLACVMLPFLLALIAVDAGTSKAGAVISEVTLPVVTVGETLERSVRQGSAGQVILLLYGLVAAGLLLRLLLQYLQLKRFLRRMTSETIEGISLYRSSGIGPGSWGRHVFLPDSTVDPHIWAHERAHVRLGHTYDLVFLKIVQALFWPNIIYLFLARELRVLHEFEADRASAPDTDRYIRILLDVSFHTRSFSFTHTFFHHPLKRRIMMLQKGKPLSKMRLAGFSVLGIAVIGASVMFNSCDRREVAPAAVEFPMTISDSSGTRHGKLILETSTPPGDGNGIYTYVDHMPEFDGNVSEYLARQLKYPESARNAKIEGRVIIRFIVRKDGSVDDVEVMRSPDAALAEEAARAVKSMPRWKPGKLNGEAVDVYFTLPVAFRLS